LPNSSQAIPIHAYSKKGEIAVTMPGKCKSFQDGIKQRKIGETVQKGVKAFSDKYKTILSKLTHVNLSDFDGIYHFCDSFNDAYTNQSDLSAFTNASIDIKTLLSDAQEFLRVEMYEEHFGDEGKSAIMMFSPLFRKMFEYLDSVISGENKGLKFIMYSMHDTSIAATLITLDQALFNGKYKKEYIKFATNMFFELSFDDATKVYSLEILHNGASIYKEDYGKFKAKVKLVMKTQEESDMFCGVYNLKVDVDEYFSVKLTAGICGGLLALVIFGACCFYRRKMNNLQGRGGYMVV